MCAEQTDVEPGGWEQRSEGLGSARSDLSGHDRCNTNPEVLFTLFRQNNSFGETTYGKAYGTVPRDTDRRGLHSLISDTSITLP